MNRRFYLVLLIALLIGIQPVLARPMYETQEPLSFTSEENIIHTVSHNQYLSESIRLTRLAEESFDNADYDASYDYAQEAIYYTRLSDTFVAIAVAQYRINRVISSDLAGQYPDEINEAQTLYNASINAWDAEEWEEAFALANNAIELLAHIRLPDDGIILPATYTVRPWNVYGDSFWNIAGRPWVYGNPYQWRLLYNANRSKLPNPNNPNLIRPGMVIDIPSIRGETREGAWDPNATYPPLE